MDYDDDEDDRRDDLAWLDDDAPIGLGPNGAADSATVREPMTGTELLPVAERVALGIDRGSHAGGGIVPFPGDCRGAATLAGLTGDELKGHQWRVGKGYRPTVYEYRDAAGWLLLAVIRYDHATESKKVVPLRYLGRGQAGQHLYWSTWLPGTLPLFGADELAKRPTAPVLVCEGEKAATAAGTLFPEYIAVCWPSGGAGVGRVDLAPLHGRSIICWPDNDPPGRRYVRTLVARALEAGALSAAMVDVPPDLGPGWDLADPLPQAAADLSLASMLAAARRVDPAEAKAWTRDKRQDAARRRLLGHKPGYSRVDPDAVAAALKHLDPDMTGATWSAVGRALYMAFGETGHALFDGWSCAGDKYRVGEPRAMWDRYIRDGAAGGPSLAWVLRKARYAGLDAKQNQPVDPHANLQAHIEEINEDHAVVVRGSKTVVAWERFDPKLGRYRVEFLKKADFHDKDTRRVHLPDEEGGESKATKPVTSLWFGSPYRRFYSAIRFMPAGQPNPGELNSWTGFAVEPRDDPEGWSRLRAHIMDNIARGDAAAFAYIMNWLAAGVQWLGRPVGTALVLIGLKGAGKSILTDLYGHLFGAHAFVTSHADDIFGKFNAHLETTLLLGAEEAVAPHDRTADGKLKDMITRKELRIEDKFFAIWSVVNHLRIIMTSNNDLVVRADPSDRRYAVFEVTNPDQTDPNARRRYFGAMVEQMETGGYEALLGELLARDISSWNPEVIPETDALRRQKLINVASNPVRSWLHSRLAEGVQITWGVDPGDPGFRWSETEEVEVPVRRVVEDFLAYAKANNLRVTDRMLSVQLKDYMPAAFKSKAVRFAAVNGSEVHRVYPFPPLPAARAAFEAKTGMAIHEEDAG